MDFTTVLFYVFSAILVLCGGCASSPRAIRCMPRCSWCLLLQRRRHLDAARAEFLAIVLVLVYVGAVMVLFLFVVMMLDINVEEMREGFWRYLPWPRSSAALIVLEMVAVLWRGFGIEARRRRPLPADYSNTKELGRLMYTEYVYPFEIAAVCCWSPSSPRSR